MAAGPASRIRYIAILLSIFVGKFRCTIIALSLVSILLLPALKENNFILTHSFLTGSAIDRVTDRDISFSSRIQPILESELTSIYQYEDQLIDDVGKKAKKPTLPENFSQFIPYQHTKSGGTDEIETIVPQGYISIAEKIKHEIPNIDIFFHKYVYENMCKYSIFIILKCKRCVPFFSNLTVSTMDKDTTFASSLLLGVLSSLADKPFLSQNHYYLLVHKHVKFTKAISTFLYSYNYAMDLPFQNHQIHISHVLDFDENCANNIYLYYEGLNGYKPPLDWSVTALNEFVRHGIYILTLPLWESLRRQAFNLHLHKQHSALMDFGIPSFTIAGKCNKNLAHTRTTLLRALHVLARDQGSMDESMDECMNFYTFISNKYFLSFSSHFIPLLGLIITSLFHALNNTGTRNPQTLFYGLAFYMLNILILASLPYSIITNESVWRLFNAILPLNNRKRVHIAIAYLILLCCATHYVNIIIMSLGWEFEVFDKTDKLEDNFNNVFVKAKSVIYDKLERITNKSVTKKIMAILQKSRNIYNKLLDKLRGLNNIAILSTESVPNKETMSQQSTKCFNLTSADSLEFQYVSSGKVIGLKTALDISARLFCLCWIIGTMFYNMAQALWLTLVLFIPLISPIINDSSNSNDCTSSDGGYKNFNWKCGLFAYYIHITLLYLPLPKSLSPYRIIYISARNGFFKSLYTFLNSIVFIPKELLEFLKFYSYGGFYSKTTSYEPISRLVSIAEDAKNPAAYELALNLFLLYPFWFVIFWVNLPESLTSLHAHEKSSQTGTRGLTK